jgi:hypothetical protein
VSTAKPADIAEEVMDTIALFGRRCNRHRELLRLRLGKEMLGDAEVCGVLDRAARLGLARGVEIGGR